MKKQHLIIGLTFGATLLAGGKLALADCAPSAVSNDNRNIETMSQWKANSSTTVGQEMTKQNSKKTAKYQVKWGDTLSAISEAAHVSLNQILSLNKIANPNIIYVDQWINLGNSKEAQDFVKRQSTNHKESKNDNKLSSIKDSNDLEESNTKKSINDDKSINYSDNEYTENNGNVTDVEDESSVKPATLNELYKNQKLLVGYAAIYGKDIFGAENETWNLIDFTLNKTSDATGFAKPYGGYINSGTNYYFNSNSSDIVQSKPTVCITSGNTVYFGTISQAASFGEQATVQEILDYVNADEGRIQKAIEISKNL